jgi:2',3'-cyclic-nucleotide 2'-phosphodiesterase
MRILFIGDIVGRPGRGAIKKLLPQIREEHSPDLIIANGENVSHGKGINMRHYLEMKKEGIDFFTSGNHIWRQHDIFEIMDKPDTDVIRPANYPKENPGRGYQIIEGPLMKKILIINLQGRVFISDDLECPFRAFDKIIEETAQEKPDYVFVDFHAEATSEKTCFGLYVDGRAHAVVGTHTHVQTSDERLLPQGTAYITDAGFVGLTNSAIGIDPEPVIKQFVSQMPVKHEITEGSPTTLNGVIIDLESGQATNIKRI